MALEALEDQDLTKLDEEEVVIMDLLKEQYPDKFNESGQLDYKWFEEHIRPNKFVYIRRDVNSVAFTLQKEPENKVGKNGCSTATIIRFAITLLKGLNKAVPCEENEKTISALEEAWEWQMKRRKRIKGIK